MKIAFVSCTKLKANYSCITRDMYKRSILFNKAVRFIEQQDYDNWYVLSAKYGLLKKDDHIEPYDLTLNNMKASDRKKWSELVLRQIEELNMSITHIDFYAGLKYREYLITALEEKGIVCYVPLQGKGIGAQLSYYTTHTK